MILEQYLNYLHEAGWDKMPKGWDKSSVKKAAKTLGKTVGKKPTQTDFFDKCVAKLKGKMDNPEAYCASLKDYAHGSTYWRGKGKSPKEVKKDVKAHPGPKKIR